MKYLKNLSNHDAYSAFVIGDEFSNSIKTNGVVSFCNLEQHVHYDPYTPPVAHLLDILYSDANGNLSFTSEVLPVSECKTPIGLCVATKGFFGTNELARWMSLKYMNYTTPETGSLSIKGIYWGNYGTDITTIDNIQITYNGGPDYGYMNVDYYDNSSQSKQLPSVLASDNTWNISILGTVNTYAMTDIDGKNKTDKILATATAQATWQTDISIDNQSSEGYAPAVCCCARYHTLGTQAGDWYLGAVGEMCMILAKKTDINTKLTAINAVYPNDCVSSLSNSRHWTSTEYSNNSAYDVFTNNAIITNYGKNGSRNVVAMLQY